LFPSSLHRLHGVGVLSGAARHDAIAAVCHLLLGDLTGIFVFTASLGAGDIASTLCEERGREINNDNDND